MAHALAQRLADLEAHTTGRATRPVPRLASDLALPDQWRVLARDLVVANPDEDTLRAGARAVVQAKAALFPGG